MLYLVYDSRSLRKTMERQLVAKATGCFWFRARRKLAFVRGRNWKQTSGLRPQLPFYCLARTPREGTEMPQAQRRGISFSPHNNGLQIPVGHFLCNFVAPLSHQQSLEMWSTMCLSIVNSSYICTIVQVSYISQRNHSIYEKSSILADYPRLTHWMCKS